jgi:hypothetical protein
LFLPGAFEFVHKIRCEGSSAIAVPLSIGPHFH